MLDLERIKVRENTKYSTKTKQISKQLWREDSYLEVYISH